MVDVPFYPKTDDPPAIQNNFHSPTWIQMHIFKSVEYHSCPYPLWLADYSNI